MVDYVLTRNLFWPMRLFKIEDFNKAYRVVFLPFINRRFIQEGSAWIENLSFLFPSCMRLFLPTRLIDCHLSGDSEKGA